MEAKAQVVEEKAQTRATSQGILVIFPDGKQVFGTQMEQNPDIARDC